jgi:WXG100 family type VII secretion target
MMTAPKVRADYDQLNAMSASLGNEAQATQKSLQALQSQMDVLQGGDWVGQGATAFYKEMGSQVLPTLRRLASALESARTTTAQINQIMAQAEAEAARYLRGDGTGQNGGAAGVAAGVVAGPGGGSGNGSGSGSAGGGGATMTNDQVAKVFKDMVDVHQKLGEALGIGDTLAKAFSQGAAAGLAGAPPAMKAAVMKVLEEGAVDRKLSGFSKGARDIVKQSPTLRSQIFELEQKGYNFKIGTVADGYFTNHASSTIQIDQPQTDEVTAAHIAHEVGHGVTSLPDEIPPTPTTTKNEFVQKNVDNFMQGEGEAQFNAAQVRAEVKAAGGPDIGIPGGQTAKYQKVYDNYVAGKITKADAISQMGTLMGNERVSTPPYQPYRDNYRDAFAAEWDKKYAKKGSTP